MKTKRVLPILASLLLLTGLLVVGGFKLQQVIAPFRGTSTEQDAAYVKYRYYIALRPSHIRTKWGGGQFSRVEHGPAVAYWPNGTIRGKWENVDGHRDGRVTTWHEDGRLRATWKERAGRAVDGTLVTYTDEATRDFIQQGAAPLPSAPAGPSEGAR